MTTEKKTVPNRVLIVGAGGFARATASLARSDLAFGTAWDVKGFLDNRTGLHNPSDLPIVGDPLTYQVQEGDIFVCALGGPAAKRQYSANLRKQGANFIILRPDLTTGERVQLSPGGLFERKVSLGPDVQVGELVTILSTTIVGYDVTIGDYCQIASFVFIGGGARIGNDVVIHPHATILPGITIGDGAIVGAGSVVIRDVAPGTTVMGNPAKPFSFR
ncbi:NeuD/PglB/VioB family sugar acetyltransferase [Acidovorax sp. SUPP3334]|uniref:NeuD/PglB/VioB family sugar acetyltransferase n=1 Tax=Acidovorax sp. SUPP3334 TaxID=2920881 RepID=UPI0023DE3C89|nr:NeuD/PglB/VioB family sugar acetyltransferase [Acidovorax sp. SUPP3334]GKT24215.1 NeuD/PglB/VioB family sugar acetyltransferase [Acidovorax sp. SUPP3334]